jgi:hypothetical protein
VPVPCNCVRARACTQTFSQLLRNRQPVAKHGLYHAYSRTAATSAPGTGTAWHGTCKLQTLQTAMARPLQKSPESPRFQAPGSMARGCMARGCAEPASVVVERCSLSLSSRYHLLRAPPTTRSHEARRSEQYTSATEREHQHAAPQPRLLVHVTRPPRMCNPLTGPAATKKRVSPAVCTCMRRSAAKQQPAPCCISQAPRNVRMASAGLPFLPPMPSNCPRAKTACTRRVNLLAHLVFLVFLVFSPTSTHHTNVLIAGLAQTEVMTSCHEANTRQPTLIGLDPRPTLDTSSVGSTCVACASPHNIAEVLTI